MLRRLLLVVDGTKSSHSAQEVAIELAKRTNARLTGVSVLDMPWITAAQPEPLGGSAFKVLRDDEVIRHTKKYVEELLGTFQEVCKKAGIQYEAIEVEGVPEVEIEYLSHEHDLIIIGQKTDFHHDLENESDRIVRHLVKDNPRPMIIVPPTDSFGHDIMVAYDGTLQSARALHMFLLLNLAKNRPVHIVTVHKNRHEAEELANQALRLCLAYGVEASIHPQGSQGDPAKILLKKVEEMNIGLIAMGAFGPASWKEVLFGNTTSAIMKASKVPLFIYH